MTLRLATGPVSWGVDFAADPRNPPWQEVLDGMRAAGYAGTELGPLGYLPAGGESLAARGLELAGGFVFEPLHDPGSRDAIVAASRGVAARVRRLGGSYVLLIDAVSRERAATAGRADAAPRLSRARADAMLETIEAAAGAIAAEGLRALVHPHAGTYVEFADEVGEVLAAFDLCLDTGHCAYAGIDPVELLERAGDRIGCVHLKDLEPRRLAAGYWKSVAAGAFVRLGAGAVDFGALLRRLAGQGYDGWAVVEQDRAPGSGDPVAELRESREHVERLLAAVSV